jgi:hypothetical protein
VPESSRNLDARPTREAPFRRRGDGFPDGGNTVTYFIDDAADIDGTGTGEIEVNGAPYGF